MTKEELEKIKDDFKLRIDALGVRKKEAAALLGVSISTMNRWLGGTLKVNLCAYAAIVGWSLLDALGEWKSMLEVYRDGKWRS